MTTFTDYQPSLPLIPNLQAGFFENYAFANQWPGHMYPSYQPQLSTQQLANNSLPSSNFPMSSALMQSTPFFAQNNTFDSRDYAGSSSSTLNTVPAVSTNEVFMKVSGRLALLNNNTKFDVTVGGVMRRTRAPENLGISLLGAVLRKAKEKDGYKQLSVQLRDKRIELLSGRRRTLKPTTFTALCEIEASKLAEDFWNLSEIPPPKLFCPTMEINETVRSDGKDGRSTEISERGAHGPSAPIQVRILSAKSREGLSSTKSTKPLSSNLLIHFHGEGWKSGYVATSSKSHEIYLRLWAKYLDCPIVSVDYSLAPQFLFPRPTEEVLHAYAWILKNPEKFG
ncbi:hypothetical protein M3Y98_01008400 [Aphelenchoides besseyi]|nr:hypothetical protein M3Y98_01008400 [Aphelenchoides besseyi]